MIAQDLSNCAYKSILYVLHTGIQWNQLKPYRNEISWQTVYYHHSRWSKDGSYRNLFLSSVMELKDHGKLDLSILRGDGSNTVAKKGVRVSGIRGTNTKRARRS